MNVDSHPLLQCNYHLASNIVLKSVNNHFKLAILSHLRRVIGIRVSFFLYCRAWPPVLALFISQGIRQQK